MMHGGKSIHFATHVLPHPEQHIRHMDTAPAALWLVHTRCSLEPESDYVHVSPSCPRYSDRRQEWRWPVRPHTFEPHYVRRLEFEGLPFDEPFPMYARVDFKAPTSSPWSMVRESEGTVAVYMRNEFVIRFCAKPTNWVGLQVVPVGTPVYLVLDARPSFGSDLVWWVERTALLVMVCVVLVGLIVVWRFVCGYNDARDRSDS